jgi:hypothetical protein
MSRAPQICCLRFKKTDSQRAWAGVNINIHPNVVALFNIAMETQVVNGTSLSFWSDKLIPSCVVPWTRWRRQWLRLYRCTPVACAQLQRHYKITTGHQTSKVDYQWWVFPNIFSYGTSSTRQLSTRKQTITFEPWRRLWNSWVSVKCELTLWLSNP